MTAKRYLIPAISEDLKGKMVFIGGPRQVGKTTLSKYIGIKTYNKFSYMNWDLKSDRRKIQSGIFEKTDMIIFDELHKFRNWKNFVKGIYDTTRFREKNPFHIIVTGSARLDIYRKGGDSLMGRYFYYKLHPFSLSEAMDYQQIDIQFSKRLTFKDETPAMEKMVQRLLKFGGFPEPFLAHSDKTLKRFHNQRLDRLIEEDIRDTERIVEMTKLENLTYLLPEKVGSLLSINNLQEDLEVSFNTAKSWIELLEKFYYIYRIYPYNSKKVRAIKKQAKVFMWDWSQVQDNGPRLENMIASHLLKFSHYSYDVLGEKVEIFFLKDKDGREVDFFVTYEKKPWFLVEVKWNELTTSKHLRYFAEKLQVPYAYQVVNTPGIHLIDRGIEVVSVGKFLSAFV